jgi:hypothetical protein
MAMGLEGYRLPVPPVQQRPSVESNDSVTYENLPAQAEKRALKSRNAWVERNLGDITEAFSQVTLTTSDLTSLLKQIEADETLVHGAYYSDDECIDLIADLITQS